MSLQPISSCLPGGVLGCLPQGFLPNGAKTLAPGVRDEVRAALRTHPEALRHDPKIRALVAQLRALDKTLGLVHGKGKRARAARTRIHRQQARLLQGLRRRLQTCAPGRPLPRPRAEELGQAAGPRYGSELGGQIRQLMSADLPFDQLIVRLGALLHDHYEDQARGVMEKMADQASGSAKGQTGKVLGQVFGGLAGIAATAAGGPAAGAAVGALTGAVTGSSGGDTQAKNNQLQAELQLAMHKLTQWDTLTSNLLASLKKRDDNWAANLRG